MKENLKIRVNDSNRREVIDLLGSLGKSFCWDVKTRGSEVAHIFVHPPAKDLQWGSDDRYFDNHANKEITPPELRELARPKECLNDKFELIVTNQPLDGWILVPDGAEYFGTRSSEQTVLSFYKIEPINVLSYWDILNKSWVDVPCSKPYKILWQRENKVETVGEEAKRLANESVDRIIAAKSKGRFLHQWAYEAFGRGEDLQIGGAHAFEYFDLNFQHSLSDFNNPAYRFRLKPQTIQIGSRTIVKPISVKPEKGTDIYTTNITAEGKYSCFTWLDCKSDHALLARNICHLTAADAIVMADALLELMK